MIRTVLKPKKQNVSINLPESYVGREVEILAFPIDETQEISTAKEPVIQYASEKVLSKSWLTPEEDEAWQDL